MKKVLSLIVFTFVLGVAFMTGGSRDVNAQTIPGSFRDKATNWTLETRVGSGFETDSYETKHFKENDLLELTFYFDINDFESEAEFNEMVLDKEIEEGTREYDASGGARSDFVLRYLNHDTETFQGSESFWLETYGQDLQGGDVYFAKFYANPSMGGLRDDFYFYELVDLEGFHAFEKGFAFKSDYLLEVPRVYEFGVSEYLDDDLEGSKLIFDKNEPITIINNDYGNSDISLHAYNGDYEVGTVYLNVLPRQNVPEDQLDYYSKEDPVDRISGNTGFVEIKSTKDVGDPVYGGFFVDSRALNVSYRLRPINPDTETASVEFNVIDENYNSGFTQWEPIAEYVSVYETTFKFTFYEDTGSGCEENIVYVSDEVRSNSISTQILTIDASSIFGENVCEDRPKTVEYQHNFRVERLDSPGFDIILRTKFQEYSYEDEYVDTETGVYEGIDNLLITLNVSETTLGLIFVFLFQFASVVFLGVAKVPEFVIMIFVLSFWLLGSILFAIPFWYHIMMSLVLIMSIMYGVLTDEE